MRLSNIACFRACFQEGVSKQKGTIIRADNVDGQHFLLVSVTILSFKPIAHLSICFGPAVRISSELSLFKMPAHRYTDAQVKAGIATLLDTSVPIYERTQNFFTFLENERRVGFTGVVHTGDMLCHPENRSGLLINAHDAHRKASKVKHAGANLKALHDAVCMELSSDPATHKDRATGKVAKLETVTPET